MKQHCGCSRLSLNNNFTETRLELKQDSRLGVVAHTCNSSTQQVEARELGNQS